MMELYNDKLIDLYAKPGTSDDVSCQILFVYMPAEIRDEIARHFVNENIKTWILSETPQNFLFGPSKISRNFENSKPT